MRRVEINESCAETLAVLVRRKAQDPLLLLFSNFREWVRAVTDLLLRCLGFPPVDAGRQREAETFVVRSQSSMQLPGCSLISVSWKGLCSTIVTGICGSHNQLINTESL